VLRSPGSRGIQSFFVMLTTHRPDGEKKLPEELSGFAAVVPYLKDPLVLAGFALFLFFLSLRFVVSKLPVVTKKNSGIAVFRLISFSFSWAYSSSWPASHYGSLKFNLRDSRQMLRIALN
jgi:hypothetical protein